jgi:hypothetical protein
MANYNKSFNFRNGVQVDDDNFVVNSNGLVGIGTSVPTEFLDVYGTAKVTGLVTTTNLVVSGVSTFYSDVKVGSGITLSPSAGTVSATTFYGSAAGLTGFYAVAVNGWYVDNANSGIFTSFKVGIGTTNPQYSLQVGQNPSTGNGFSVDSITGNVKATGIITASSFSGDGASLTTLNASNISSGTLNNARLPSNVSVGIITANSFNGSLTGTATTASSITSTANITVNSINSGFSTTGIITAFSTIHVGTGGTAFSALNSGRIGVGTALPTSEFQIRKSSATLFEILNDTSQARISIGQSVGVGKSTAALRFGNTSKTFDIINNDTGNINTILHGGPSGVGTGRFAWVYGQDNSEKMSLTYGGNLGLGITNSSNTFHVVGTSTITSNSYVGDTLYVTNDIYLNTLRANSVASNTYVTSGISTFSTLYLYGGNNVLGIGTNNAGSYKFKIEDNLDAYLGNKAKLGTQSGTETTYFAGNLSADASLLKVFGGLYARTLYVDTLSPTTLTVGTGITATSGIATAVNGFSSGIGTAVKITTVGNRVYFTVVGVGVTSLQLF